MSLDDLDLFVRMADARSVSGAAALLGIPKSRVSRALQRLEARLGVALAQRSTRSLRLTAAGEQLHQRATEPLRALRETVASAAEGREQIRGALRLGVPSEFSERFGAELVARFAERHPGLRLELEFAAPTWNLVAAGFDLAVRPGPLPDSSLVARKIGALETVLVASPIYAARRPLPEHPEELASHDCVLYRSREGRRLWSLRGPAGKVEVEVGGRIVGNDFSFVRAIVETGAGIGMLPWILCRQELRAGRLLRVLPEHRHPGGNLYVVHPPTRHLPARTRAMRDFLLEHLRPQLEENHTDR